MRLSAFFHLLLANLFQRPWRLVLTLLSLVAASFFLTSVLSVSLGVPPEILKRMEAAFPAKRLIVRPPAMALGPLQMEGDIAEEQVERLRGIEGVAAAYPIAPLRVPISLRGEIVGQALQTDSFVWGVPAELVSEYVAKGFKFDPVAWRSNDNKVPAVVPAFFLDMYNSGFARASGLPQVNRNSASGRPFTLLLNTTTLTMGSGKKRNVPAQVVGVADDASLLAVLMPLETVKEMNEWHQGKNAKTGYLAVHVDLKDLGAYDRVFAEIEAMGLRAEGNRDLVATARYLTLGGSALLAAVGLIVALIAAVNVFNTFALLMMERRAQIGLFCAIGGSKGLLARLYLGETLLIALAGGGAGAAAAWALLGWAEVALFSLLPKLTFLPDRALWLSPALPLLVSLGMAALCALACLPPLLAATRRPPGEIISGANP